MPYGAKYSLNLPERGMVGEGYNFDTLSVSVKLYRKANAIPVGLAFEDELEQAVCEKYPQECSTYDPTIPVRKRLKFGDVLRGTMVMVSHKLAGSPLVDQAEANARAKTCSTCIYNIQFPMPCSGICAQLKSIVNNAVGNRSTPYDSENRSCGICGCHTSAAVHLPLEIQCIGVTTEQRAQFARVEHCWKQCV